MRTLCASGLSLFVVWVVCWGVGVVVWVVVLCCVVLWCVLYSMFCDCGLICVACRRAGVVVYVVCSFGLMCDVRYWFCVMAGVVCFAVVF